MKQVEKKPDGDEKKPLAFKGEELAPTPDTKQARKVIADAKTEETKKRSRCCWG